MNDTGFMARTAVVGGILMHYEEKNGGAGGQAVIFLHGWRSRGSVWVPVARGMNLKGPVYALDLPGFGASEIPKKAFTIKDYAHIVSEFIEAQKLNNVVVIGHSFGGRVAIKLASEQVRRGSGGPIKGIVLVDSAGFNDETVAKKVMRAAAKPFRPLMRHPAMHRVRRGFYKLIGADDYLATPELTHIYLNTVKEDLTVDLAGIDVPTLIVWGDRDTDTPVSWATRMHELIRDSRIVIMKGAGHFPFIDDPQAFIKVVREYLDTRIPA